jgi:xylose dehydrogenase (NAD/NADP)
LVARIRKVSLVLARQASTLVRMTIAERKIRCGVLGYARIARESVIPAILRSTNSEFVAVASRDAAKLAESSVRFKGGHRTYVGYEELLRDPQVDAVYIPLPNSQHCEWTIRAMEHGKHVLCEKPLALDAAECRRMIAAAEKNGVKLMEAFMYRYTDRTKKVVETLRSGVLGEVKFVQASFRFLLANPASIKLQPALGGGALYDVGCYPVNFAGLVADTVANAALGTVRPESVAVECVREGGVDRLFSALVKYPSGLVASLNCGFNAHKRIGAEIVGTEGVLEIPDTFFDPAGALMLMRGEECTQIAVAESDRYRGEVEDFAAAILEDRAPHFGLGETLRNAEVLDQLFAASR